MRKKKADQAVMRVRKALRAEFPTAEAKLRFDHWIEIRIIDARFCLESFVDREAMVFPLLHALPQPIMDRITDVLLLTPTEKRDSLKSKFFDNPRASVFD